MLCFIPNYTFINRSAVVPPPKKEYNLFVCTGMKMGMKKLKALGCLFIHRTEPFQ